MSKEVREFYVCDICGEEMNVKTIEYPIIFHAENDLNNGYIHNIEIDVCYNCLDKILKVEGWGKDRNYYDILDSDRCEILLDNLKEEEE